MWISFLLILLGSALGLEIGKVEVRDKDVLIYLKEVERITVEVLDPPRVNRTGPNLDPKGLRRIFKYIYAVPCYGLAYYEDESEDIIGLVKVGYDAWAVETRLLPKRDGFYLLPLRICPCFSDVELREIDFWNKPLEVACTDNSLIWINYTHREALKELGFEGDIVFRIRIRDKRGDTETLDVRIPNP